jgi:hypothetical protein
LKRLIFVVLASLIWVLSLSLVAAQETTETPTEAGTRAAGNAYQNSETRARQCSDSG